MGRLRQETWDDKETGKQRSKLVVVANDVVFLDSKQDSDKAPEDVSDSLRDEIDALPF